MYGLLDKLYLAILLYRPVPTFFQVYWMSLVQKVVWASEVLKLGSAVLWTDMGENIGVRGQDVDLDLGRIGLTDALP